MDEEYHIPISISTFLDNNNFTLMKFKGMSSIHKVKCAYLMNHLIIIFL